MAAKKAFYFSPGLMQALPIFYPILEVNCMSADLISK